MLIAGEKNGHNVPIHLIAADSAIHDAITGWNWSDGMIPDPGAPVWRMDEMRSRLHEAFSPEAAR
jgi:hypothetical protein